MSYVTKVLLPGETVLYETGLHWLVYLRAVALFIIAVALAIVSTRFTDSERGIFMLGLAGVFLILALLATIMAAIRRASTELAVTDQRVIFKQGIFSRHTIEMNRSKVESVDVDQSILGRILGYGTILLRGTGGSLEPMASISDPLTLRSHITAEPVRHGGRD